MQTSSHNSISAYITSIIMDDLAFRIQLVL